jgi:small subunit ribosomal protein S6
MTNYELMLILDPSISEDERTSSLENIKEILKKAKAKVSKEDLW